MILAFPESIHAAQALAAELNCPCLPVSLHRFPDGESKVSVPSGLNGPVCLYRSLDHPNDKLIELLLAARTLRQQGVRHLSLVAPYLCYMRQDIAFQPGEAVSQGIIGAFLAELFDAVITVDPHLHRIERLDQAIPNVRAVALSAARLFGDYLAAQPEQPVLIGPDEESRQWVSAMADYSGLDYAVAHKQRGGDTRVSIELPAVEVRGRAVWLVDDMASTGRTLATITRLLLQAGAQRVDALVTHALFVGDAIEVLRSAGIQRILSSDSIPHPSNAVALAPLLATALKT